jgi:hypothetical protein
MVSWREPDLWSGCVRTVKVVADILFHLRFSLEVDARLREPLGRRGKIAALIIVILNTIDLTTVPVLEVDSNRGELATTVKLPKDLDANLRHVASLRQTSMNPLMNSAIWVYTEEKSKKTGKLQPECGCATT